MDRTPVFMYDRVTGTSDLLFIPESILSRSHMVVNDQKSSTGESCVIRVVPTTKDRPHRMIVHYDGEDFQMLAVDDRMIRSIKSHMFTRELINKHLDKTPRRRYNKSRLQKLSSSSRLSK